MQDGMSPTTTQFTPKRKFFLLLVELTASRKKPPKATWAPRLWQRVSSTTSQTAPVGINRATMTRTRILPSSSHSQTAERNKE